MLSKLLQVLYVVFTFLAGEEAVQVLNGGSYQRWVETGFGQ